MKGLLTNPFLNVGLGLLGRSGPSLEPTNAWAGIQDGLLNMQRAKALEQNQSYREQQMMDMERQRRDRAMKIAQEAKQRQQQETWLSSLPEEQRAMLMAGGTPAIQAHIAEQLKPEGPRRIIQGPDGKSYYESGEEVLPGVEAPAPEMTPYQSASLELQRQQLAAAQAKAQAKVDAEAAQSASREKAKIQTNKIAIQSLDDALDIVDNNFFASGMASNLVPDSLAGTAEQGLRGKIETAQSAIGLEKLLEIKAQGGTFGALGTVGVLGITGI